MGNLWHMGKEPKCGTLASSLLLSAVWLYMYVRTYAEPLTAFFANFYCITQFDAHIRKVCAPKKEPFFQPLAYSNLIPRTFSGFFVAFCVFFSLKVFEGWENGTFPFHFYHSSNQSHAGRFRHCFVAFCTVCRSTGWISKLEVEISYLKEEWKSF